MVFQEQETKCKHKYLIVIDMQNDFINGSLGSKEAQAIVSNVANKIRNFDGKIVLTRDTHTNNYLHTFEGSHLPIEHCIKDSIGWSINDEIFKAVRENLRQEDGFYNECKIINKSTFRVTDFDWNFYVNESEADIESIEIVGLCTDICVISNALSLRGLYPNIEIKVDASCCAGVTPENHKAALKVMKNCQINIINEDE